MAAASRFAGICCAAAKEEEGRAVPDRQYHHTYPVHGYHLQPSGQLAARRRFLLAFTYIEADDA